MPKRTTINIINYIAHTPLCHKDIVQHIFLVDLAKGIVGDGILRDCIPSRPLEQLDESLCL